MALIAERSVPWREGAWDEIPIRQAVNAGHSAGSGALRANVVRGGSQAWRGSERILPYPHVVTTAEGIGVSPLPGARADRLLSAGREWNLGGLARYRDLTLGVAGSGVYTIGAGFAICPQTVGPVGEPRGSVVVYNDAQVSLPNPGKPTSGYRYDCVGIRVEDSSLGAAATSATFEVISGTQATSPTLPNLPPGLGESHWGLLYVILRASVETGSGPFLVEPQNAWKSPVSSMVLWSAANLGASASMVPPLNAWGDMNTFTTLGLDGTVEVGVTPRRDCWMKFDVILTQFAQGAVEGWIVAPKFTTGTPLMEDSVPNYHGTTGGTLTAIYGPDPTMIALLEGGTTYRIRPHATQGAATTYNAVSAAADLGAKRPKGQLCLLGLPLGRVGPYRYA